MHFAKKYFLSFLFIIGLGILQLNTSLIIKPAQANNSLLSTQGLLTSSAEPAYGSGAPKDVKILILNLIQMAMSFLAILTVVFIVIAGFKYMTSGGNEAKMTEALDQIKALVVGLFIILAAWGITKYVLVTLICRLTQTGTVCPVSFW
jgi:hypothetical protein